MEDIIEVISITVYQWSKAKLKSMAVGLDVVVLRWDEVLFCDQSL